jgi:NADH-quinone oxidoreductase subunit C
MSQAVLSALKARFPDAGSIREVYTHRGDDVAVIDPVKTVEICSFLKFDPAMDMKLLLSVTAVDYLGEVPRFEVVTMMTSLTHHHRIRLRARPLDDNKPVIPSIAGIWRGADWWERHVWDMYGIQFKGHTNLKRLYMPEDFVGHPLRKDYPLRGRQPIVPERGIPDVIRGPGPSPQVHNLLAKLPVLKG